MPPQNLNKRVEQLLPPPRTTAALARVVAPAKRPSVFGHPHPELFERLSDMALGIGREQFSGPIALALLECRSVTSPMSCDETMVMLGLADAVTAYLSDLREQTMGVLDTVPAGSTDVSPRSKTLGNIELMRQVSELLADLYDAIDKATPGEGAER